MAQVNAYLTFNGTCEAAFLFYKSVFGGEFRVFSKFKDMPPMDGNTMSEEDANKMLHVALPISNETILMGSDTNAKMGDVVMGQNIAMSATAASKEEADKLFNGLAAGGQITMPIADTFWNAYFGMLTDKFGVHWMVNYDHPTQN